jgi:hypothetical protein
MDVLWPLFTEAPQFRSIWHWRPVHEPPELAPLLAPLEPPLLPKLVPLLLPLLAPELAPEELAPASLLGAP